MCEGVLDFRKNGVLSISDAAALERLEPEVRKNYNNYLNVLISENTLNGKGLFIPVTCRNTTQSKLLDHLCYLSLLERKLIQNDEINRIIIDNVALEDPVRLLLKKYNCSKCLITKEGCRNRFNLSGIKNFIKCLYFLFVNIYFFKICYKKRKPDCDVIFIDTFLFQHSFNGHGEYEERFYTGHEKYLSASEKTSRWFSPTLVGIRKPFEYRRVLAGLKKTSTNFFIEESWVTIQDYFVAFCLSFYLPLKIKKIPYYNGLRISSLVRKEVRESLFSVQVFKAVLKYLFIKRLANNNINIKHAIDWNENQIIDRALNLGFKAFYPSVEVRGYQGFLVPEHYACAQPQEFERQLQTLPDVYYVLGPAGHALRASSTAKLDVKCAPAFRYTYLFDIKKQKNEKKTIVLALPIILAEAKNIVDLSLCFLDWLDEDIEVLVKPHPSYTVEQFIKLVPVLKLERFTITQLSMQVLLERMSMMISSTSTSCVEAVSLGIPVAIVGNRSGVTMNPIPKTVNENLWGVFYTSEQLSLFVDKALKIDIYKPVVEELFEPVTREGARALFTSTN